MLMDKKPIICNYCKKLIDIGNECFEEHEGKFYHADGIDKKYE